MAIDGPVRVRFAPSPTGFLHIGGVRTALFNWLFAKHYGGQFLLRIEDTDEARFVPGAADALMDSLRWIGITWDEGPDIGGPSAPYVQSERKQAGIYQPYVEQLLEQGKAYMSFTTSEELDQLRAASQAAGHKSFRFRGPEREWPLDQQRAQAATGQPFTVRLKVPTEGTTSFSDLIRGGDAITVQHSELYDIVLLKTTGMPVYHLAHLVDDHLMGITHVMRSEEWVPSAPYHVLLYQAFGWAQPQFAHLPVVLRQDGRGKLSKRKDDVGANRFWERGYLAEAMFNYLALQGWSYDDRTEIMTRDEIIERFSVERIQSSPARWNPEKLRDLNGIYIRKLSTEQVSAQALPFMVAAGLIGDPASAEEQAYLERLIPLVHQRLEELGQAPELLAFFFRDVNPDPALLVPKKMDAPTTAAALQAAQRELRTAAVWSEGQIEELLRALCETLGLKPGQLFGAIRVAATGSSVAPPLFETLAALGKPRTLDRLAAAAQALS